MPDLAAMTDGLLLTGLLLVIGPALLIVAAVLATPSAPLDGEAGVTDP